MHMTIRQKAVGRVVGTRLVRKVSRRLHYLYHFRGYAWPRLRLISAQARGIKRLELHEDTGAVFCVSLAHVLEKGRSFHDINGEEMLAIPEREMIVRYEKRPGMLDGELL